MLSQVVSVVPFLSGPFLGVELNSKEKPKVLGIGDNVRSQKVGTVDSEYWSKYCCL